MSISANGAEARCWQRHRAARVVIQCGQDADDLAELLDMLGLTAVEGRFPPPRVVRTGRFPGPRRASEAERDLATNLLSVVTQKLW